MPATILSNPERRLIANLSIPRNLRDLDVTLHTDPFSGFVNGAAQVDGEGMVTAELLALMQKAGLVVSLGSDFDNPGSLAAAMDAHLEAIDLPDEKAHTYEGRLSQPHRMWRVQGEQFVLTHDGFDMLHEHAGVGDPTFLQIAEVERRIQLEAERVQRGEMLEEEYADWAQRVADAHEREGGVRPRLPMSGGAGYADATETLIIDAENGKASYTETAPWYMAAVTVAITDADTGSTITEAPYTGYARKSVAAADMNAAASPGGSASNANAITFAAATGGTAAVIGFGKCAASTAGRLIKMGTCSTVNVSATQQPLTFTAGAFTTSVD